MDPEGTHAPRGWPFPSASVLHLAIAFGPASLLGKLLQRNSSHLDAKDAEENTPLQLALREDLQDLALMILERSRTWQAEDDTVAPEDWPSDIVIPRRYLGHVNTTNIDGETPLSLAVSIKADMVIRALIDTGSEIRHERSLLFYAISQEDKALVYQLMKEGSNLDGAVFFTTQCLNRADANRHILEELLKALLEGGGDTRRPKGAEIDHANEFDEDEEDDGDEEALFVAIRGGRSAAVNLLLSYGSSANMTDPDNVSLITLAVEGNHEDIAMALFWDLPKTIFIEDLDSILAFKEII
ncbi:uncharacterized protein FMAN_14353 [Fusarium mangiferae]|uniref:Uncharacterized protein n=1 Tax=Fusarium mangiferae TaxID=192010 RepID=A0A1L7UJQ7_FUSMA|nr:uncharacterized protein FMAN_14353 [Fusarium mangiferae]CVL07426.1 uncharacterized protein FMAN_14353 [Fusarium mangiferae]